MIHTVSGVSMLVVLDLTAVHSAVHSFVLSCLTVDVHPSFGSSLLLVVHVIMVTG
jgi:hypothetical protein